MAKKILSAKSDFIFKLIFGDDRNVDILAEFLSAVLDIPKEEYESITIIDPNLRMEFEEDKLGILDVKIHTKSKTVIDIEIPDVDDGSSLWKWLQFLRTDGEEDVLSMLAEEDKAIKKAVGILKELSEDERTRLLYEQREKAMRDYRNGIEGSYREGRRDGREEGIEQGIEQGIEAFIQLCEEEQFLEEKIILKIQEKFHLDEIKAMGYYQQFKR